MSYARFGEDGSVVYVIATNDGIECCGCVLEKNKSPHFKKRCEVLAHLRKHRRMGHAVPQRAFDRLNREIMRIGDDVTPRRRSIHSKK